MAQLIPTPEMGSVNVQACEKGHQALMNVYGYGGRLDVHLLPHLVTTSEPYMIQVATKK